MVQGGIQQTESSRRRRQGSRPGGRLLGSADKRNYSGTYVESAPCRRFADRGPGGEIVGSGLDLLCHHGLARGWIFTAVGDTAGMSDTVPQRAIAQCLLPVRTHLGTSHPKNLADSSPPWSTKCERPS
jgi:hypothetical protein